MRATEVRLPAYGSEGNTADSLRRLLRDPRNELLDGPRVEDSTPVYIETADGTLIRARTVMADFVNGRVIVSAQMRL